MPIEAVTPSVDCGRYPAKRILGEHCVVEADIFRHGRDTLRAVVKWRRKDERRFSEAPMTQINPGLDHWRAEFPLEENARYTFTIEAWTDRFSSWVSDLRRRAETGQQDVSSEVAEGLAIIQKIRRRSKGSDRDLLTSLMSRLRADGMGQQPQAVIDLCTSDQLAEVMLRLQSREDATVYSPELDIIADRPLARFGAWYEMFVRSQGTQPGKIGTLKDAKRRLADIKGMGFDVVYLAPIHPIGLTNRKGPNNRLECGPNDPGSPWAIGNDFGGHKAVDPSLGTLGDFDHFVNEANRLGMEIALDFAIQCSPDHHWVKEHPRWFYRRPDRTIQYAENPPKKYEDIYPINFENPDWRALWEEQKNILLFWIDHGVRIFRVDNPHTKPLEFWRWLIEGIHAEYPEVIFLSEAFTKPKMMRALAKVGFTQSYTYFTWRNTKWELIEYLTKLTKSGMEEYFRPNFFTNTPDILTRILQEGGRPAFKMRLVLAATLSPSYGIYSGYELCENEAALGTEEYKDSEKYQVKVRDWNREGNIKDFIAKVNAIRRSNPAMQRLTNLDFLPSDNDQILFYCKKTEDMSNVLLVAVNLDPLHVQECTVHVPESTIGLRPGDKFTVKDLLTDAAYVWSAHNYVRLDPQVEPAHILRVER
jgi:starch synthase (maltosyl-transferring)